jgi:hypothetical protein
MKRAKKGKKWKVRDGKKENLCNLKKYHYRIKKKSSVFSVRWTPEIATCRSLPPGCGKIIIK